MPKTVLKDVQAAHSITWIVFLVIVTPTHTMNPPTHFQEQNCKFEYQSQVYDFSGLGLKSWIVSNIPENSTFLMNASFSLCNRIYSSPCGRTSFCVVSKDGSKWSSLQSTLHEPERKENEDINVSYVLDKIPPESSWVIDVELKLKCSVEVGEPEFVAFKDRHLILLWKTVAACKVKYPKAYRDCIINDHQIGKVNLQSLRHLLFYTTNNKNDTYYINICGGTVNSSICGGGGDDIAACKIDSAGSTTVLGLGLTQRILKNPLSLEYRNTKKSTVKIEMLCNSSVVHGELKFKSETNAMHTFELETPLACIEELENCSVQDKQNFIYDLSALSHKDYEVHDKEGHKYILSVCRSVKNFHCPEGASVCLENGYSSLNLGTLQQGPEANGVVSISSSGGAYCDISNFHRYRSVILFKCAKTDSLELVSISANCLYTFEWNSKVACPFSAAIGVHCRVIDPVSGNDFDFKSLNNPIEDYIIKEDDGSQFHINVCGDLVNPCNGSRRVGVCKTDKQGKQYPIGDVAVSPHYNDGRLSFELNGECESNHMSSKVIIIFKCSHHTKEISHPIFLRKDENCTYYFVWYTAIICATFTTHECTVSGDNGDVYDLSPLSLYDNDYIVWQNTSKGLVKFIINMCQPIMFGHGARCLSETGICMQNMSEPNYHKSFTNLGLASGLRFDKAKKVLKIEYTDGDICLEGSLSEIRSVIFFTCDKENKAASQPKFLKRSNCQYEFEWKTTLACSKNIQPAQEITNCNTYHSYSGIRTDFSSFANQEYLIKHSTGELFRFTICGSLNNVSLPGVGICHETEKGCENIGMGNSNLQYNAGRLFLNYTDGVNCSTNAKIYSIIEFKCDTKDSGRRLITFQEPCSYLIIWFTSLACVVPCITDGPRQINLSFLTRNENNYKITSNGVDYFISICKPLVPIPGLTCYHGSAICKAIPQLGNKWSKEVNLGFPHYRPMLMDNSVILNYSSNVTCPINTSVNLTSSIVFTCDFFNGIGAPVYNQSQSDCHYEFLWKTSVICEDYVIHLVDPVSDRVLHVTQSNLNIDLRPLCRTKNYNVKNYVVSICQPNFLFEVQRIENLKNISYGRSESALFNYSENKTKLFISNGDECEGHSSDKYHAVISLLCVADEVDHLHILKETDCSVEIEWRSSAACAHFVTTVASDITKVTSKSSASIGGVVGGLILAVVICLIVYFVKMPSHSNCCRRYINRYLSRRHQGEFHYSLVSKMFVKEA